jgi:hypothetical protein
MTESIEKIYKPNILCHSMPYQFFNIYVHSKQVACLVNIGLNLHVNYCKSIVMIFLNKWLYTYKYPYVTKIYIL